MTEAIHMTESQQIEMVHAMLDNAGIPRRESDRELSLAARVSRLVAQRSRPANPWQPVETAPKDGQWVIVYEVPGMAPQWHPHWVPISQGDTMTLAHLCKSKPDS